MRQVIWVAAIGVIVLAGTGIGARAQIGESIQRGDEKGEKGGCSEATLRGAYGLQFQGTRPVRPPFAPGIESFIGVAIRTYDGEGQFTQVSNVKGAVIGVEADVESTGTYQVKEDCSGTNSSQFVAGGPVVIDRFVIVDGGREVRLAVMTPVAIMNLGVMQKIHTE